MLPFCGYNMGDYFKHWLSMGAGADQEKLPRIYYVNWFRKDASGKWLWPGYGENSRVLKWIIERLEGTADGKKTAIGVVPTAAALDLEGLKIDGRELDLLLSADKDTWKNEASLMPAHLESFGEHLPQELWDEYNALVARLNDEF
jgi:phosphoenolpyruvate carboxykinase (GTP)